MAASHSSGTRTPAELRKFGLSVGGIFLVLAAISAWRGHVWPPAVMGTVGALLFLPGLVAPRVLGPVERRWMVFAEALGRFNARIILSVLYYVLITPVGIVRRWRVDPLDRRLRDGRSTSWIPREPAAVDPARYRQQF
jgi:hypothetical protein